MAAPNTPALSPRMGLQELGADLRVEEVPQNRPGASPRRRAGRGCPPRPPITTASGSRMLMTAAIASPNLDCSRRRVATAGRSPPAARGRDLGQAQAPARAPRVEPLERRPGDDRLHAAPAAAVARRRAPRTSDCGPIRPRSRAGRRAPARRRRCRRRMPVPRMSPTTTLRPRPAPNMASASAKQLASFASLTSTPSAAARSSRTRRPLRHVRVGVLEDAGRRVDDPRRPDPDQGRAPDAGLALEHPDKRVDLPDHVGVARGRSRWGRAGGTRRSRASRSRRRRPRSSSPRGRCRSGSSPPGQHSRAAAAAPRAGPDRSVGAWWVMGSRRPPDGARGARIQAHHWPGYGAGAKSLELPARGKRSV